MLASAAFGGTPRNGLQTARNPQNITTLTEVSDSEDARSITESEIRRSEKNAFPIKSITCVGCALPGKVGLIDEFIRSSAPKMAEHALFKTAALVYQRDIVEPARREGVCVPAWSWRDLRDHYSLHFVDPRLQRMENVRSLAAVRKTLELSLLREDPETGERVVDKQNSEQLQKIIALQSKEISLLEATNETSRNTSKVSRGRAREQQ
jgi:hypothetical protein